jgi:hypothetical protein
MRDLEQRELGMTMSFARSPTYFADLGSMQWLLPFPQILSNQREPT